MKLIALLMVARSDARSLAKVENNDDWMSARQGGNTTESKREEMGYTPVRTTMAASTTQTTIEDT
jgi:hypothetical protein